ncbi:NAD(+) synthase [Clostridium estertheticum]|uniref:NAD(+) synthase n=1 Tax=Clostridium estertheticum TaxID=238834 RepID=UPI001C7D72CF|nr:NAD(+) synthase [Clostridium estertheticum]MBX4268084.1 NAD(+) synthase [Clostridium estertheticum]WLC79981.1 NAD(+) synthase [Clostridium estertheticum]
MKTSFIKVSAACPIVNVADIEFNLTNIQKCIKQAYTEGSKFIVFPELCITAYTCADLFLQQQLLKKSEDAIKSLCEFSENKDILIAVGSPLYFNDCLYNCAYIIFNGKLLGIVPKSYIPNYSEFYEKRWFAEGLGIINKTIDLSFANGIPFGTNLLFTCGDVKFGFEICEDLWVTIPPSSYLSLQGANIIANLSASNELVSKADYRKSLVSSQSARCMCSYLYASSGVFESSTDLVFSGHLLIGENGLLLKENNRFQRENEVISSIIDINKLNSERMKNTSFRNTNSICPFEVKEISFQFENMDFGIFDRNIDKYPFVPSDLLKREVRCAEIFNIQSSALAKRFSFTGLNKAIVGISGGLDSTLALLVIVKTFDKLKIPLKNIITITMPGFGTTDRTYLNAINLCKNLGTDLREINIVDACLLHFKDIGHPVGKHDVTYENVQARERTQILMDLANKEGGLLIGTGDLSELALGWCTYNGDHMSMYSVNCSIPKTLVRYLVKYVADKESSKEVTDILLDILDTPVSPELLPKDKSGKITQKTEDIVGPYVLHDFFLYYFMKQGATPEKILFLAKQAFKGDFEEIVIVKWLDKFIKRFFTQQFKRSALPDGPKVGTISVSPRGDLRMPSDASYNSFL